MFFKNILSITNNSIKYIKKITIKTKKVMKYVLKACITYRKTYLSNAMLFTNMYGIASETPCASNNDRHKKCV